MARLHKSTITHLSVSKVQVYGAIARLNRAVKNTDTPAELQKLIPWYTVVIKQSYQYGLHIEVQNPSRKARYLPKDSKSELP